MELSPYEAIIHTYSLTVIIPTLLGNALLLFLILKQPWKKNYLEGILLIGICVLDLIFAINVIGRYIYAFSANLDVLKIHEGGNKNLSPNDQLTCDWSGALLFITMHSSSILVAAIGYIRYVKIVKQTTYSPWFYIALFGLPISIVISLSLAGAALKQYVLMPGGLGCHIWSPIRDDPIRTPIQIFFAYNILFCYLVTVYSYIRIGYYHNYVLDHINSTQINKPKAFHHLVEENNEENSIQSRFSLHAPSDGDLIRQPAFTEPSLSEDIPMATKHENFNSITSQEAKIIGFCRQEIEGTDSETNSLEAMSLQQQKRQVKLRIFIILGIYTLCHVPECIVEQMEILTGYTRSSQVDSIATNFRSLIGLANCLVVLLLHTQTRKLMVDYWYKFKSTICQK